MYRTIAAALVAALTVALASCGGTETTTVSRAELVHRLETACLAGQRVTHEHLHGGRPRNATEFLNAIITSQRFVLKRIGNLETRGPAKAVFDGLKDIMRRRLAALERVASAPRADFQRMVAQERPRIDVGTRTHAALVALGARHVCM